MVYLLRFLSGWVSFAISGSRPGAFVNELIRRGFNVWGIRAASGEVFCCVRLGDYREVQRLARSRSMRVHITARRGVPVIVGRNRRRSGLAVGLVLFAVIFRVMSLFLWNVEICELDSVSRTAASETLARFGVYEGARADFESLKRMQTSAMLTFGNLSWMTINVDGSFAEVNATEKREPETNDTAPRNIKACCDGQVIRADVYSGMPAVNAGDAVLKGELLIGGVVETERGGVRLVRADGSVPAKTKHTETFSLPASYRAAGVCGAAKKRYSARLFGVTLPLSVCEPEADTLSFRSESRACFKGAAASASLIEERLYPFEIRELVPDEAAARKALHKKMMVCELLRFRGRTITSRNERFSRDGTGCTLTVDYACEEDIAAPSPLLSRSLHIRRGEPDGSAD